MQMTMKQLILLAVLVSSSLLTVLGDVSVSGDAEVSAALEKMSSKSITSSLSTEGESESLVHMLSSSSDDEIPANALVKVLRMTDRLKRKIKNETKLSEQFNVKYLKWCADSIATNKQEIAYHSELAEKAYAILVKTSAAVSQAQEKIDDLAGELTVTETQLRRATEDRERERADYEQNVKDLKESLLALTKALSLLEGETRKYELGLPQLDMRTVKSLLQTFKTAIDATTIGNLDKARLVALVQSQHEQPDDDDEPPAYQARSGDIVNLLIDMKEKAMRQLSEMEDDEIAAQGAYDLLKIGLLAEIEQEKKALDEAKAVKAKALKEHAEHEKDYNRAKADMDHNKQLLADNERDCSDWKTGHKKYLEDAAAEIEMLNKVDAAMNDAINITGGVQDMTEAGDMGQNKQWYDFFQRLSSTQSQSLKALTGEPHFNEVSAQVVGIVKTLAKSHKNMALAQLASRMKVLLRYGSGGTGAFDNVINLIKDMIAKMESAISKEEGEMAFCEKDMNETKKKLTELGVDIEKLDRLHEASYMREVDIHEWLKEIAEAIAAEDAERQSRVEIFNENERQYYLSRKQITDALSALERAINMLEKFYGEVPEEPKENVTASGESQHDDTMAASGKDGETTTEPVPTPSTDPMTAPEPEKPEPTASIEPGTIEGGEGTYPTTEPELMTTEPQLMTDQTPGGATLLQKHRDANKVITMIQEPASLLQVTSHEHNHAKDLAKNHAKHHAKAPQVIHGKGIIEMLMVIRDDLIESLRLDDEVYQGGKADYEDIMRAYVIARKEKGEEAKYLEKEEVTQHRSTEAINTDEESTFNEKEQLSIYYLHLRDRCIARPQRFDDRKKARDAEIRGLKNALNILTDELVLMQKEKEGRNLRGLRRGRIQLEQMALRS